MVNELSNENEMILLSNDLQRGHVGGSGHRVIIVFNSTQIMQLLNKFMVSSLNQQGLFLC